MIIFLCHYLACMDMQIRNIIHGISLVFLKKQTQNRHPLNFFPYAGICMAANKDRTFPLFIFLQ